MSDLHGFDANEVEPPAPYVPLPKGTYCMVITESDMRETKDQTGQYLYVKFEVIDGEYTGRTVSTNLNLINRSEAAVAIARQSLAAICKAVGVLRPVDSMQLHDLPLLVDVRVKKRNDNDNLTNEIAGYKAIGEARPAANPAPIPVPAASPGAGQRPAWMKPA